MSRLFAFAVSLFFALHAGRVGAAVPGHQAGSPTGPRILQYADERALPARERDAVFEEYALAVRAALADSDFARANELAGHATRVFPASRRAWNHLAATRLRLAQWGPAIEAARKAAAARDDAYAPRPLAWETQAGAAYWEGVALYATQRYGEAAARLRVARAQAPEWAEAARALAECIFVAEKPAAAAPEYAAAFALDPDVGTVRDLTYHAEAQAAAGDLATGVAAMQEALRRAPFEPGLHAKLGDLLRREGRLADAYYELVYEIVLHGLESQFARAVLAMQDQLVRDASAAHAAHGTSAERPHSTREQADMHEIVTIAGGLRSADAGDTHRAARQFEHALAGTRSASPLPHILFADAVLRDKQPKLAQQALEALLETHPDCVPALWLLAEAQRAQGRASEAETTLARVKSLYPGYWRLRAKTAGD